MPPVTASPSKPRSEFPHPSKNSEVQALSIEQPLSNGESHEKIAWPHGNARNRGTKEEGSLEGEISSSSKVKPSQEQAQHHSGSLASIATLCNSAVGAGVLSLPYAFSHAGLIGGFVLCLAIGLVEGFTLWVLAKFSEHTGQATYSTLVKSTLGGGLSAILAVVLVVQTFGSCSAYLIIIGDTFSSLFSPPERLEESLDDGQSRTGLVVERTHVVLVLGLLVVLPMSFAKKLGHLSSMSSLAVAGFIYTALVVIAQAMQVLIESDEPLQDVALLKTDFGMLSALPIIIFGFNCHANAIAIYHELVDKPDSMVPWSWHPKGIRIHTRLSNMYGVIFIGIAFIMAGYLSVGASGYIAHPLNMSSNVLNILPTTPVVQAARFVIGVVVLVHYPVTYHPGRDAFKDIVAMAGWEAASRSTLVSSAYTIVFVLGSMAVAITVQELGQVISLIGGSVASFIIFFNPGLMLIKASYHRIDGPLADPKEDEEEPMLPKKQAENQTDQHICFGPRASWWSGMILVVFSIFTCIITITLAVKKVSVH